MIIVCEKCNKEFTTFPCRIKKNLGRFCSIVCARKGANRPSCSEETKKKIGIANSGPNQWKWKAQPSYSGLHKWLVKYFGNATHCINIECLNREATRFQFALIKGKVYERNKDNFIMLCSSCHKRYDNGNLILSNI